MSIRTLLPLTLLACAPAIAFAQRADTLPAVVVTATRIPVAAAAAPASVSVISGEQLRREGITRITDAIERIPGVSFAQTGSFGGSTSLFLRGGESKYVKVLIDGVPVNAPGGAFDFGTLTVDNVDRIEVVRGPASVLYGADAVTGVIQIFTRPGGGHSHATVSARAGTYGSGDASAAALGALGGGARYSLDLSHHQTNGIYAFNNAYRNNVASGLISLEPDDPTTLRLTLRYSDYAYHYPTNYAGQPVDSSAVDANDLTTLGVDATRQLAARVNAQITIASHESSGGTNQQPDVLDSTRFVSLDHVRRRSADGRVNLGVGGPTILTIGASLEQEDQRSQSDYESGGYASNTTFGASRNNSALYAQLLSTSIDRLTLTAGGRYDDNQKFGSFGTWRMGASVLAAPGLRVRASAGTGFREPTFAENYSTSFTTGNPLLRPEQSRSWEAGAEQRLFNDRVTVGATHFEQEFRNMIDYTYDTTSCGASYCNVARARSNGQEFELAAEVIPGLSIDANFTHLDTRVLDPGFDTTSSGLYRRGEQLVRRPRTSWNFGLAYSRPSRGGVDVRVTHQGDRTDKDYSAYPAAPVVLAAYTRTDLGGELVVVPTAQGSVGTTLTLRAENAFDTKYTSVYGYLTPRRTILAGVRLAF